MDHILRLFVDSLAYLYRGEQERVRIPTTAQSVMDKTQDGCKVCWRENSARSSLERPDRAARLAFCLRQSAYVAEGPVNRGFVAPQKQVTHEPDPCRREQVVESHVGIHRIIRLARQPPCILLHLGELNLDSEMRRVRVVSRRVAR